MIERDSLIRLVSCRDYRSFISIYKEERSRSSRLSYSMIARRAGFSARSFPRDVVNGQKRLTLRSLQPMLKGLGLRGDLAEYFKTLVFLEHPETCIPRKERSSLEQKLKNLKDRILANQDLEHGDPYRSKLFPLIYAACGSQDQGALILDIQKKTALSKDQITQTLNDLVQLKIVSKRGEKYFPNAANHLCIEGLEKSDAFKAFFRYLLEQAAAQSKKNFSSDKKLFFTSCLSVRGEKLQQLKTDLKDLLRQYVDASEDPDGDTVVSLVCSLL
jgi:uncharacterized protein (TIGR02147 family)